MAMTKEVLGEYGLQPLLDEACSIADRAHARVTEAYDRLWAFMKKHEQSDVTPTEVIELYQAHATALSRYAAIQHELCCIEDNVDNITNDLRLLMQNWLEEVE